MGLICDLCDLPLKTNIPKIVLVIAEEKKGAKKHSYYDYDDVDTQKFTICKSCHKMILLIFRQRKKALRKLLLDIQHTWKLPDNPSKKPSK